MSESGPSVARTRTIPVFDPCLVVFIGANRDEKRAFAAKHFAADELESTPEEVGARLEAGLMTVVIDDGGSAADRTPFLERARAHDLFAIAIVFRTVEPHASPADSSPTPHRVARERHPGPKTFRFEGFRSTYTFRSPESADLARIVRRPLEARHEDDHGPFDIIGDIHGCGDELEALLERLGYESIPRPAEYPLAWSCVYRHPAGRRVIFLGDLMDRGPRNLDCLRIAATMVREGQALLVPGNHDEKLRQKLERRDRPVTWGMAETLAELDELPAEERAAFEAATLEFFRSSIAHRVLDDGKLVVAHAGLPERYHGRSSPRIRKSAIFGERSTETDKFGHRVRSRWAEEYRGEAMVVHGHTVVSVAKWLNRTIDIDTGCVFGGSLTALRYPEKELVSVPAARAYADLGDPYRGVASSRDRRGELRAEHLLDHRNIDGAVRVSTALLGVVTTAPRLMPRAFSRTERFSIDPRWLITLPPRATSLAPGREHLSDAFAYYRSEGVETVVCEEIHGGMRVAVVVCRDESAAKDRFGVDDGTLGACYTRTGRPCLGDPALTRSLLDEVRAAAEAAGTWDRLATGWLVLDCELMPISVGDPTQPEWRSAAIAAAAHPAQAAALGLLEQVGDRVPELAALRERLGGRQRATEAYLRAQREHCWPVESVADLRLAPLHMLASEQGVHQDRDHRWHRDEARALASARSGVIVPTRFTSVDPNVAEDETAAIAWADDLRRSGAPGVVVKPIEFVARGTAGVLPPALACRREENIQELRGPEFPLDRPRPRRRPGAVDASDRAHERRLRDERHRLSRAVTEFALGLEALERFVRREPLRRVHECVFASLARR